MAATEDMAPGRSTTGNGRGAGAATGTTRSAAARPRSRSSARRVREDDLEAQVARLQDDIKKLGGTLAGLADSKVTEARSVASDQVQNLVKQGQNAVENIQDEFGQVEKQIKDMIREKPLTAVAGAMAIGFVLALVTR